MASIRLFSVFALANYLHSALCVPQATITDAPNVFGSALADLNGGALSSSISCGGCYVVADVAAIVWYSQAFINTVGTAVENVYLGNGTRTTRTSIIENESPFTYDPASISSAGMQDLALTPVDYEESATVSGAVLTSPTAYNVFSAFSITSSHIVNGVCVTASGSAVPVIPAYSEVLPSASGRVELDSAGQRAFIDHIGFSTCSIGGARAVAGALVPVANVTQSLTQTFTGAYSAAATLSLAPTTIPSASPLPGAMVTLTEVLRSTTVTATLTGTASPQGTVSAPLIVGPSLTLTPTPKAVSLPVIPAPGTGILVTENSTATSIEPPGTGTGMGTGTGTGTGNYSTGSPAPYTGEAGERIIRSFFGTSVAALLVAVFLL